MKKKKINRKDILTEAIRAICDRCAAGEARSFLFFSGSHADENSEIGHFFCPANPIWELIEKENRIGSYKIKKCKAHNLYPCPHNCFRGTERINDGRSFY